MAGYNMLYFGDNLKILRKPEYFPPDSMDLIYQARATRPGAPPDGNFDGIRMSEAPPDFEQPAGRWSDLPIPEQFPFGQRNKRGSTRPHLRTCSCSSR